MPDLLLGFGALVVACGAAPVQAQVGREDAAGRTRVDVHAPPWTSIGKLQAVAGSLRLTCTAAHIGAARVLTAAHCLYNPRTGRFFLPQSLHFLAGLEGSRFTSAVLGKAIASGPGWDAAAPDRTRASDWAVVTLAGPVSDAVPVLPLSAALPRSGTPLRVGGYAQDNPNVLTADSDCRIVGTTTDGRGRTLLVHNCASTHGVSGAPLLAPWDDGTGEGGWRIVGINVAHSVTGPLALAVPVAELAGRL